MPTETILNSLKVHKVPDFETWEENYNQTNGIGTSDVVVIPPEELKKGVLPDQTNNSGKFLSTNGTSASWETVDALPSQSGNSGKFLTTDGADASWVSVPEEVFIAIYNTTTYADVLAAYNAGKIVVAQYSGSQLALYEYSNSTFYFSGIRANTSMQCRLNSSGWGRQEDGLVISTRTVNGKALSSNITLTASDVGAADSSHAHGNITNDGDITATAPTIVNGDQLVINDNSESKITNGPTFDGSTTTKYLSQKGTWESIPTINYPVTSVNGETGAVVLDASDVNAVATSAVGANSGVAPLNASGKIDSTYLPSYVDDVIEGYYYNSKFYTTSAHTTEITGETGKIFVDLSTNKTYRYGGSSFTEISQGSVVSVSRDLTSGTKIGTLTINGTGTDLYAPAPETFTVTGGASTIVSDNLTANRALISNTNGKVAVSDVTSTELGYLDGVTSAIQTQIDGKQAKVTASGILKGDGSGGVSAATAGTDYQAPLTIDSTPTDGNTTHVVSSDGTYDKILARTKIYTASCSTTASTAAKVATLDDSSGFSLTAGVTVAVRFTYGNSAGTPTLRVDGTTTGTAKTIVFNTSYNSNTTGAGTTYNTWGPYETVIFTYNGAYWVNTGSSLGIYNAYNKADSITASSLGALTSESDPIFSASAAAGITSSNISTWNGKQDALPSQTNNSGKFLTTNGSALSWGTVDALPSQTNNSGKFLTTNGTSASWATVSIPTVPTMDSTPTNGNSSNTVSSDGVYDMVMGRTKVYTATCSTAAATAAKVATLDDSTNFSLTAGVKVAVTFTYGNSAATPTLRVDGTTTGTAKTIAIPSSATAYTTGSGTSYNTWGAYETVLFTYTGTYWVHEATGYLGYLAYNTASGRQAKITASGILKGDGAGGITAATAGTDYAPAGNYKTTQTAVSDPTASGTSMSFIDTISQNTNGVITATKKSIDTDTVTGIGIDNTPTDGSVNLISSGGVYTALLAKQNNLPSQSGNSGKFLTTNGSILSWDTVDALPSQSGNSGKFLTTNGTTASWSDSISGSLLDIDSTPTASSNNLVTSGGVYTAMNNKANIASPTFTGTPAAPTATAGTNTTQIATTAFVGTALNNKITYGTTDLTAGTSSLATGVIYLVYE